MSAFRITFSKLLLGLPFEIAAIDVRNARDPERALKAAELKFERWSGIEDWRLRADVVNVDPRKV